MKMILRHFMKRLVRFWPFHFFILWITIMTIYVSVTVDPLELLSLPPSEKKKNELKLTITSPIISREEPLEFQNGDSIVLRRFFNIGKTKIFEAKLVKIKGREIAYISLPFKSHIFTKGNTEYHSDDSMKKTDLNRYYDVIRTTTGSCRKMVQLGGQFYCNTPGNGHGFDGNKIICIDPVFQIATRNYDNCMVMSFGIHIDTSFDEAIANLKCDVHMFDIRNFEKAYLKDNQHMHFHQIGLQGHPFKYFNNNTNDSLLFENFNNIVVDNQLDSRVINLLKMDIEGHEWDSLQDISSQPFLNIIGQIAVEVHAGDLLTINTEEKKKKINYWISVIQALEARGFRRVSFFENKQRAYMLNDTDGSTYEMAGEMLLVNSNWYDEDFRRKVRQSGYNIF